MLELEDEAAFDALVDLGCGVGVILAGGLKGLLYLGKVADKYGMDEVLETIEEKVLERLTLNTCGELLTAAASGGLHRVEEKSKRMAMEDFEAFSRTDEFFETGEEALGSVLAEDGLCAEREEAVFEAVAQWMAAPTRHSERRGSALRGEGLLRHVRFSLMSRDYLSRKALEMVEGSEILKQLVRQALASKARMDSAVSSSEAKIDPKLDLSGRAHTPRGAYFPAWPVNTGTKDHQRLQVEEQVFCVALIGRRVVCGLWSGEMQVWDLATRTRERRLVGHTRVVGAVVAWGKWVVSGSSDGQVRAWDPETGQCEAILWGHTKGVSGLAAVGMQLLSGSDDGTVRVWGLRGPPREWRWERSLRAGVVVRCVAGWEWRAVVGGADGMIRVWHATTGELERMLMGHRGAVLALAVSGSRLASSSEDSTVRVWSLTTGECEGQVAVGTDHGADKERVRCLAMVGSHVVGGTERGKVQVWERASLENLHSEEIEGLPPVRQLFSASDWSLIGCAGTEIFAWG